MYPKSFRTKTGYCHILEDRILLTRGELPQNWERISPKSSRLGAFLVLYGVLSAYLMYSALSDFKHQSYFTALVFALLSVGLIVAVFQARNNSATPVILRRSIVKVKVNSARKGLARTYLTVFFNDESGRGKKRFILLPGALAGGEAESEKAIRILREEHFIA